MAVKKTAYCPDVENYYKKHDRWHSTGRAGDLCLMDFGKGRASHIGIVEKANSDGTYTTIEGNTSRSSDDNGGVVMRRTRSKSVIRGFARPDYDPEKYTAVKKTSDKGAIKWMQKKLNSLTSGTNIEVDGNLGKNDHSTTQEILEAIRMENNRNILWQKNLCSLIF